MKKLQKTLSLSNLFYPVSTYYGNLDFSNNENDFIENDINDGILPKDINYNNFDNYSFLSDFTKEFAKTLELEIKNDKMIIKAFKKYGVEFGRFSFWSPNEYNFQTDSVDVELVYKKDCRKELKKEIVNYLENERKKTCSGYLSLEPEIFKEVELDNYCYLHAIAEKEDLINNIKNCFENAIECASEDYSNLFHEAFYNWIEPQKEYKEWKKAKEQKEFTEKYNLTIYKTMKSICNNC